MNLTKKVSIAVACVAGVTAIGYGAVTAYKAQEHANRAIIEQSCVMNGHGKGECSFTNTGKTVGAVCGNIEVRTLSETKLSDKFCSGQVEPMSTTKVEFTEPFVEEFCDNGLFNSWTDKCAFNFVATAD